MSATGQVDYDALAAKHGGVRQPDYDRIAAKYGGAPTPRIDWDSIEGRAPGSSAATAPPAAGAIDWDAIEKQGATAPKTGTMSRLWEDFREGAGLPSGGDFGTKESNVHALEHPLETLANTGRGMWQTYKGDVGTAESHLRAPGWRNKAEGVEQEIESAVPVYGHQMITAQEQTNRGDTSGGLARTAGIGASILAPKAIHEAPHALENIGDRAVRAVRTSPTELAERAKGPLEASTAARQGALAKATRTARANLAPVFQNIDAADQATGGGMNLDHVIEDNPELAPKQPKTEKLTAKELQDAGFAARQAEKMASDGLSEKDIRQNLKQFGYTPGSVNRAIDSLTEPNEEGGYTISRARGLRQRLAKLAQGAEGAGNYRDAARFSKAYGDVTDAIRERVSELDPQGRLLGDFDKADAAYAQAREDERILSPLLDALEGNRTPSPEKFQAAWEKLTAPQRSAIQRLAKDAGLDRGMLERQGNAARKVLLGAGAKGAGGSRWTPGRLLTYEGARALLGLGAGYLGMHEGGKHGMGPWRYAMFPAAAALGYGVGALATPPVQRAIALGALEELPRANEAPRYAPMRPSVAPEQLARATKPPKLLR